MKYPNLVEEHKQYWCLEAMARSADVTPELMAAILNGDELLMADEALNLARYMMCKPSYLFSPTLSVLNNKSSRHRRWMAELNRDLYEIWEASKKGDYWALEYMRPVWAEELEKQGVGKKAEIYCMTMIDLVIKKKKENVIAKHSGQQNWRVEEETI